MRSLCKVCKLIMSKIIKFNIFFSKTLIIYLKYKYIKSSYLKMQSRNLYFYIFISKFTTISNNTNINN